MTSPSPDPQRKPITELASALLWARWVTDCLLLPEALLLVVSPDNKFSGFPNPELAFAVGLSILASWCATFWFAIMVDRQPHRGHVLPILLGLPVTVPLCLEPAPVLLLAIPRLTADFGLVISYLVFLRRLRRPARP